MQQRSFGVEARDGVKVVIICIPSEMLLQGGHSIEAERGLQTAC